MALLLSFFVLFLFLAIADTGGGEDCSDNHITNNCKTQPINDGRNQ